MTHLKHIGFQILPEDLMNFYVEILNGKIEGFNKIPSHQSARIFKLNRSVSINYIKIGDLTLELFLTSQMNYLSYQHICLEMLHPELVFKSAVERGFDGYSSNSPGKENYFIKDKAGNLFELKNACID